MDASPTPTAEQVIATLRDHAAELRQAGVRHVSLFGSLARGEASPASDIDLVVELDPAARIGIIRLTGIERRLAGIFGRAVDLLPEPIEQPRNRAYPIVCRRHGSRRARARRPHPRRGRAMPGTDLRGGFSFGEEAARLMPSQPWGDIRGMGNRLRHAYDRLSLPVIWHAIQDELPTLEADVRLALIAAQLNRQG